MLKAHKYRLYPTNEQIALLAVPAKYGISCLPIRLLTITKRAKV